MIDLLTFQGRDVEIFKQAVERHNGAIQVLIHPLGMIPELDDPGEPVVSYFERLKSLIANSNPEIPIVAFIESPRDEDVNMQNIDKFRTFFDSHAKGERKVFFVRTRRSNPLPDTSGSPMERMTKDDEMRIWDQLIERLRSLGVKKAFISGRNYRWHSVKHDMYAVPDDLRKYVELGFPVARSDDCLYLPGAVLDKLLFS